MGIPSLYSEAEMVMTDRGVLIVPIPLYDRVADMLGMWIRTL